jgi:hypothetical protein
MAVRRALSGEGAVRLVRPAPHPRATTELVEEHVFNDRWLLLALLQAFEAEGRTDAANGLRAMIAEAIHPLAKRGGTPCPESAAALGPRLLGGAGPVMRSGERAPLGPTRAHQTVHVHLTTSCLVTLELWMPFATMPCGSWRVHGPGSTKVALVPNETLAADLVKPDDFGVIVAVGNDGEFPTWITFAP